MQAKSKEIQGPRKKEQGEEAGVGDAKLALLKFLPLPYSCAERAINL